MWWYTPIILVTEEVEAGGLQNFKLEASPEKVSKT
jgi:hypothetical protein